MFERDPLLQIFESNVELCDCDPKHRQPVAVQKNRGLNVMGVGGNHGKGTVVLVCTKCGERVELDDNSFGPDLLEKLPGPDILPDRGPL